MSSRAWARALIQRDTMTPGSSKRAARPVRYLEGGLPSPSTRLEAGQRRSQIGDSVHEDRSVSLDVVGQEHQWWPLPQLDTGNPRPHRLDGEGHPSAQDVREIREVAGHVATRRVEEVELLEWCFRAT